MKTSTAKRARLAAVGLSLFALTTAAAPGGSSTPGAGSGKPKVMTLDMFGTGLTPISKEAYAKLPKAKRHRGFIKDVVDLSDRFPAPGYQGPQGTCTAWATTYAARGFLVANEQNRAGLSATEAPSPDYVYGRVRGGAPECRTGMSMQDALEVLRTEGVVTLGEYPHSDTRCPLAAPDSVKSKAARLRIGGWRAIERERKDDLTSPISLDDIKAQLSSGRPVVVSYPVSDAFKIPSPGAGIWKGAAGPHWHAMAVVGYDNNRQAIRIMNSWGNWWADHGYAWIDYATFERDAGEAYVLDPAPGQGARPPEPPPPTPAPTPKDIDPEIASLIAATDCAALRLTREGGRRVVTGFGGLEAKLEESRRAVQALDPKLEWRVAVHRWPQCEAELTLAGLTEGSAVRLEVRGPDGRDRAGDPVVLTKGEDIGIGVETRADRPFVHVIYIQADGSAVEVYRGAPAPGPDGRRRALVGADGPRGWRFRVNDPLGEESLVAVASAEPLFGTELRSREVTERQFLTLLKAKIVAAERDHRAVSAAVLRMRSRQG